ncbi:zinc ribbon domain-containing protein, partial [Acinetobacter baumannii]
MLSGLCFCEKCGDRMSGKTAHGNGGKFAYYEHIWQTRANANHVKQAFHCEPPRVQADRIEEVVWREVKAFLTNPDMAKAMLEEAKLA